MVHGHRPRSVHRFRFQSHHPYTEGHPSVNRYSSYILGKFPTLQVLILVITLDGISETGGEERVL